MPEQKWPWPAGRRQSCGHFLTCVSNHAGETGLVLENRPWHPAKLSIHLGCPGYVTDAAASHDTAAPVQIPQPPTPRLALFPP